MHAVLERAAAPQRWTMAHGVELLASLVGLALVIRVFSVFARAVELRPGVLLDDPVLAQLRPHDMTGVIFATMYASVLVTVLSLRSSPTAFLIGLRAYAIMILLRIVAMSVTPFDAPLQAIPLQDPVVQRIAAGQILTRDLFFSGHTATVCVLALSVRRRAVRAFLVAAAVVVGASVLVQAVHYTVDVVAAPAFAYLAYRIAWTTARRPVPAALPVPVPEPARGRRGRRAS